MEASTEGNVGWVSGCKDGRGTADLLYGCGFTILLSTWNALHLNIPSDDDTGWTIFLRKLKWMLLFNLIPEYVTVAAATEWWDANFLRVAMESKREAGNTKPISLTQAFFPIMGGYALTMKTGLRIRVDGYQFYKLFQAGVIQVPSLTTEEINDRSKGDWVTKSLACLQVSWYASQVSVRAYHHLPITTLEVYTLAATVCALITYGFWWNKPLDVQVPVVIPIEFEEEYIRSRLWDMMSHPRDNKKHFEFNEVRFRRWNENTLRPIIITVPCVVVLASKACHLSAWNFSFPTEEERIIWRFVILLSLVTTLSWVSFFSRHPRDRFDQGGNSSDKYLFLMYLLCRAFILVEICIGLRSVSRDVYKTVGWVSNMPHF